MCCIAEQTNNQTDKQNKWMNEWTKLKVSCMRVCLCMNIEQWLMRHRGVARVLFSFSLPFSQTEFARCAPTKKQNQTDLFVDFWEKSCCCLTNVYSTWTFSLIEKHFTLNINEHWWNCACELNDNPPNAYSHFEYYDYYSLFRFCRSFSSFARKITVSISVAPDVNNNQPENIQKIMQ